jgi:hypothetical protein
MEFLPGASFVDSVLPNFPISLSIDLQTCGIYDDIYRPCVRAEFLVESISLTGSSAELSVRKALPE